MRLIDADDFLQREIKRCGCVPLIGSCDNDYDNLKQNLANQPTIDLIHAVGGCYCRECKWFVYEYDRPRRLKNLPKDFGRCSYIDFAHKDTCFCSFGIKENKQNEK